MSSVIYYYQIFTIIFCCAGILSCESNGDSITIWTRKKLLPILRSQLHSILFSLQPPRLLLVGISRDRLQCSQVMIFEEPRYISCGNVLFTYYQILMIHIHIFHFDLSLLHVRRIQWIFWLPTFYYFYLLFHLLDDMFGKLEMFLFSLSVSDSKTTDNSVFSLEALIPNIIRESISLDKMKKDWVDGKLRRRSDYSVNLIVFEELRNDIFADGSIGSDNNDMFFVFHITGKKIYK